LYNPFYSNGIFNDVFWSYIFIPKYCFDKK
jgi:hypothetical protein